MQRKQKSNISTEMMNMKSRLGLLFEHVKRSRLMHDTIPRSTRPASLRRIGLLVVLGITLMPALCAGMKEKKPREIDTILNQLGELCSVEKPAEHAQGDLCMEDVDRGPGRPMKSRPIWISRLFDTLRVPPSAYLTKAVDNTTYRTDILYPHSEEIREKLKSLFNKRLVERRLDRIQSLVDIDLALCIQKDLNIGALPAMSELPDLPPSPRNSPRGMRPGRVRPANPRDEFRRNSTCSVGTIVLTPRGVPKRTKRKNSTDSSSSMCTIPIRGTPTRIKFVDHLKWEDFLPGILLPAKKEKKSGGISWPLGPSSENFGGQSVLLTEFEKWDWCWIHLFPAITAVYTPTTLHLLDDEVWRKVRSQFLEISFFKKRTEPVGTDIGQLKIALMNELIEVLNQKAWRKHVPEAVRWMLS